LIAVSARLILTCLHTLLIVAAFPLIADAQIPEASTHPRRTIQATRLEDTERIALDGRLDEAVWERASPAADFIQIDPSNGSTATEATEVRIVFSKDAIYMGVTCFDSEPDKWLGFQRRRDEFLPADDRFMWTIDTFLDERSGYFFDMNPSGLMADSLFGINGDNRAWDGIWNARIRNQLQERALNLMVFGLQLHSQDSFGIEVDPTYVRLDRPFAISPGITMPQGAEYHFTRFAVRGQTANRRLLAMNARFETGGFYSGHRNQTVVVSQCEPVPATSSASTASGIRSI
jgi:hypothetical protein